MDIIGAQEDIFETASNRSDCIVRFLIRNPRLLLFEDFDVLHTSAFDFILRDIWNQLYDTTNGYGQPIIFAGNIKGLAKIEKLPTQIRRRISKHVNIETAGVFNKRFVETFMKYHFGDVEVDDRMVALGHQIANHTELGHLSTLKDLCIEARDMVQCDEGAPLECLSSIYETLEANRESVLATRPRALPVGQPTRLTHPSPTERRQLAGANA